MGTANACDFERLAVGERCIITVDSVNSPTGTWWGRVTVVAEHDTYLSVGAVITGRFELDKTSWRPIYNEGREVTPSVNYIVYPDTETVRNLMWKLEQARSSAEKWERRAKAERTKHLEVMTHLVKTGAMPKEEQIHGT